MKMDQASFCLCNEMVIIAICCLQKLKDSDCINNLLIPYYESLHTQGTQYIAGDVEDYLCARGTYGMQYLRL